MHPAAASVTEMSARVINGVTHGGSSSWPWAGPVEGSPRAVAVSWGRSPILGARASPWPLRSRPLGALAKAVHRRAKPSALRRKGDVAFQVPGPLGATSRGVQLPDRLVLMRPAALPLSICGHRAAGPPGGGRESKRPPPSHALCAQGLCLPPPRLPPPTPPCDLARPSLGLISGSVPRQFYWVR